MATKNRQVFDSITVSMRIVGGLGIVSAYDKTMQEYMQTGLLSRDDAQALFEQIKEHIERDMNEVSPMEDINGN